MRGLVSLGGNLFWLLLARRPFWGIGSAQCYKLGSELASFSDSRLRGSRRLAPGGPQRIRQG